MKVRYEVSTIAPHETYCAETEILGNDLQRLIETLKIKYEWQTIQIDGPDGEMLYFDTII